MARKKIEEKLYEDIRSIQKKAAEMDAALTAAEERKEAERAVEAERTNHPTKERTFANPQNINDITLNLPTLEELAKEDRHEKTRTKEEILEAGTLIEKLRLFFASEDLSGYFNTKGMLTEEEKRKILASVRTQEDRNLFSQCSKEYSNISTFGNFVRFFFQRFQVSFATLAVLLNKWECYETTAKQLTLLYRFMLNPNVSMFRSGDEDMLESEKLANLYYKEFLQMWANDNVRLHIFDGAALYFDETKKEFAVDIEPYPKKESLYSYVKAAAKDAENMLAEFKAYAVVVEEYITASTLKFTPASALLSIKSAEEEHYTRGLVKDLSFFRSELNRRKDNGENITPDEERRAMIPDYYEVKPSKMIYKDAKSFFKNRK